MCISRMVFVHATLFLLSASAMGCAAGQPAEYQRGTFTPPPPAPLRPGVGAPVLGQPGQSQAVMPRSPHRRVLPPTREPGVWAGDQPRAAGFEDVKDVEPLILGVRLPYINEPPLNEEETWPVRWCAAAANTTLEVRADPSTISALTMAERECLAAMFYAACAGAQRGATMLRTDIPHARAHAEAMAARAAAFRDEKCNTDSRTPRVFNLVMLLVNNWKAVGP
jgi:hypothetical protein